MRLEVGSSMKQASVSSADNDDDLTTPDLFKVLIGEVGQNGKADIVLGKALRLLSETDLLKPVSDLLHRGSASSRLH
jgi:hypothetical protein